MSKRGYQSRQEVMCAIMDYLYAKESEIGWVTKHHIRTKTPRIRDQTSKRITEMLEELVKKGLLETSPSGDRVLYRISEKGRKEYAEWVRKFLEFSGHPTVKLTKPK